MKYFNNMLEMVKDLKINPQDVLSSKGVDHYFEYKGRGVRIFFNYQIFTYDNLNWQYVIEDFSCEDLLTKGKIDLSINEEKDLLDIFYSKIYIKKSLLKEET